MQFAGFSLHRHPLVGREASAGDIGSVHQNCVAMGHTAIHVSLLVDDGVVLAVAAGRDQGQHQSGFIRRQAAEMLRMRQLQHRQGGDFHPGPAAGGGKRGFVE